MVPFGGEQAHLTVAGTLGAESIDIDSPEPGVTCGLSLGTGVLDVTLLAAVTEQVGGVSFSLAGIDLSTASIGMVTQFDGPGEQQLEVRWLDSAGEDLCGGTGFATGTFTTQAVTVDGSNPAMPTGSLGGVFTGSVPPIGDCQSFDGSMSFYAASCAAAP